MCSFIQSSQKAWEERPAFLSAEDVAVGSPCAPVALHRDCMSNKQGQCHTFWCPRQAREYQDLLGGSYEGFPPDIPTYLACHLPPCHLPTLFTCLAASGSNWLPALLWAVSNQPISRLAWLLPSCRSRSLTSFSSYETEENACEQSPPVRGERKGSRGTPPSPAS